MPQKQIFLSHRSSQKAWLKERLIPKLEPAFKVWLDEREIKPLEPITEEVRQGIAESHLFLAWWFDEYEASEPCHFELITALAHCRAEGEHSYRQRVFFAGPDAAREYAEAGIFKGLLASPLSTPPTEAELDALVAALNQRAEAIDAGRPFGATKLDDANRVAIPPDTNFVGRAKELLQLFGRLIPAPAGTEGGNTAVMLVSGIGGEGKTELAKEFTRRFGAWFADSLRLGLQGDAGEGTLSARLTTGLRFEAKARGWPLEGVESLHDLRGLFERSMKRPFLWLLDDLPSSTTKEEGEFLVAPLRGGISLLTGRATVPGLANFKLDELSQEDGTRLLARLAAAQLTDAERLALYRAVNGHALSLNLIGHGVAAGLTANEFLSPATPLIDQLEVVADLIDREKLGLKAVLPTLLVSLRLIPEDHPARQVLALIAQLASAPVPVKLLEQALDRVMRVKAISFLENRGFLTRDIRQTEACLRLHPLLAAVVRALPEEFGAAEALAPLLDAVDAVFYQDLQAIIKDAGHFRRTALSPLLLPHARNRAAAGLAQDKPDLAGNLGSALYALGDLSGARATREQVLDIRRSTLGPEHPDTLTSLNNLANTLRAQGDLTGARALQEQVSETRRRTLEPEHPDTLTSMNNLASTLQAQGDLTGARALQEQVSETRRRTLGPEHPATLTSINNLALTLWAQGDLTGARALHEQVLEAGRPDRRAGAARAGSGSPPPHPGAGASRHAQQYK